MEMLAAAQQFVAILVILLAAFGVCMLICMASILVDEYRHNRGGTR